jgi:hypothetical protein
MISLILLRLSYHNIVQLFSFLATRNTSASRRMALHIYGMIQEGRGTVLCFR